MKAMTPSKTKKAMRPSKTDATTSAGAKTKKAMKAVRASTTGAMTAAGAKAAMKPMKAIKTKKAMTPSKKKKWLIKAA